jgi:hypothetical protein
MRLGLTADVMKTSVVCLLAAGIFASFASAACAGFEPPFS